MARENRSLEKRINGLLDAKEQPAVVLTSIVEALGLSMQKDDLATVWRKIDELKAASASSVRIRELAREMAQRNHEMFIIAGAEGHEGPVSEPLKYGFDTCPHPDCRLVRE